MRKMQWVTYDPSANLKSPEQKAITAAAADIWTPKQMDAFLDHTAAHRLCGCALTLLGLRREEVASGSRRPTWPG